MHRAACCGRRRVPRPSRRSSFVCTRSSLYIHALMLTGISYAKGDEGNYLFSRTHSPQSMRRSSHAVETARADSRCSHVAARWPLRSRGVLFAVWPLCALASALSAVAAVAHALVPSVTAVSPRSGVRIRWPVDYRHPELLKAGHRPLRSQFMSARAAAKLSHEMAAVRTRRLRVVSSPSTPTQVLVRGCARSRCPPLSSSRSNQWQSVVTRSRARLPSEAIRGHQW